MAEEEITEGDIVREEDGNFSKVIHVERFWLGAPSGGVRVRKLRPDGTEGTDGAFLRRMRGLVKVNEHTTS